MRARTMLRRFVAGGCASVLVGIVIVVLNSAAIVEAFGLGLAIAGAMLAALAMYALRVLARRGATKGARQRS